MKRTMTMRWMMGLAAAGGAMLLGGCHKTLSKDEDQRTAEGQVLPGSISDAMLPYDAVTSTPPLAPPAPEAQDAADAASQPDSAAPVASDAASASGDAAGATDAATPAPGAAPGSP